MTQQGKHTPGPWRVDDVIGQVLYYDHEYQSDCQICYVPDIGDPEQLANAYVLAAAPEMLAALEACLPHITKNGENYCRAKVFEAIAKARGVSTAKGEL
jgi:hypothetical protein